MQEPPGDGTATIQPAQVGRRERRMNEPVKRKKKLRDDDPAKEQRIAEIRRMLDGMQRPRSSSRLMRATAFEGISLTNQIYLSGARFAENRWTNALWWAA